MWSRALPGSMVVIAALVAPEFSVGAGGFGAGNFGAGALGAGGQLQNSLAPSFAAPPQRIGPVAGTAKAPLANVPINLTTAIGATGTRAVQRPQILPEALPRSEEPTLGIVFSEPTALVATAPVPIAPGPESRLVEAAEPLAEASFASALNPALGQTFAAPVMRDAARADATNVKAPQKPVSQQSLVTAPLSAPATGAILATARTDLASLAAVTPASTPLLAPVIAPMKVPISAIITPEIDAPSLPSAAQAAPVETAITALPAATKPLASAHGAGMGGGFALETHDQLLTRVDGKAAGELDFRQTPTGLLVRLGSIVEVLSDRYERTQIERIRASAAGDIYLSLPDLKAQGIPISYDPVYDEFNIGQTDTRPKAAHKVHMDQISSPERGLDSSGVDQVGR